MAAITPGRFILAETDPLGARDSIALVSTVRDMREMFETALGSRPGLLLIAVDESERTAAVERIHRALSEEEQSNGE